MQLEKKRELDSAVVVIFGASGDLTKRKLVPAFYSLACEDHMPTNFHILGVARSELTDEAFHERLYEGMHQYGRFKPSQEEHWPLFSERVSYLAGGYDDPATYRALEKRLAEIDAQHDTSGNRLFYLSIPPSVYPLVIEHLGKAGLSRSDRGWTRIIIEKPFGHDLESAQALNEIVHTYFDENQVYRIDHYLGKETVQNILTFRFANSIFEPLWNRNYIDHVQISVLETVDVGHRGGYYDKAGVVRDMFQNHLLQLVSLTAMEPPVDLNAKALRDEKVKVIQAIPHISQEDGIWGQYEGYRESPGVPPDSITPTYLGLKLFVNTWRWQGVPFYLRSGKSLAAKTSEIIFQFKRVPHLLFEDNGDIEPNTLSLCIQPDEGIHLRFETKIPGAGMRTDPATMEFHYESQFGDDSLPDAYERLLLDALQGDAALFARGDEIESAWTLIDPILKRWERMENPPLAFYKPGSWGPIEADTFMARDGFAWMDECGDHD
jgi:glucose-6-phosphate 1-dehydrogenase